MSAPLYQMTHVGKWYGEKLALRVPTLSVFQGSIVGPPARSNSLRGILFTLTYQSRTGDILATVAVESVTFSAKIPRPQLRDGSLYPGQEVWVIFDPKAVTWL